MRSLPEKYKARSWRRRKGGFTLVELLVVLVILSLLVGIVGTAAVMYLSKTKPDIALIQMKNLSLAMDLYRIDMNRYPTTEEGLSALVRRPPGLAKWKGPYLNSKEVPLDPWDRPYVYERPTDAGQTYVLLTFGADGVKGGEGENADVSER